MTKHRRQGALPSPMVLVALTALGAASWTSAGAASPSPAIPALPATVHYLVNGLPVLLAPDPNARRVSVQVTYRVGQMNDPPRLHGLAHLAERLVAARTEHLESIEAALDAMGASQAGAETDLTETHYFESVAPGQLAGALWVESDRMGFAASAITAERLGAARAEIGGERRSSTAADLPGAVPALTLPLLCPPEAVGESSPGDASLEHATVDEVRGFLSQWYRAGNATLAIAGRFDPGEALREVERYFGPLSSTWSPAPFRAPGPGAGSTTLRVRAPISSNQVEFHWRVPRHESRPFEALELTSEILNGPGSPCTARTEGSLLASCRSRVTHHRDWSVFSITASVPPNGDPEQIIREVDAVLTGLGSELSNTRLVRPREALRRKAFAKAESTWGRAALLVSLAAAGVEPGPDFDWGVGRYERVDISDVRRTVRADLLEAPRAVVIVHADPLAPERGVIDSAPGGGP